MLDNPIITEIETYGHTKDTEIICYCDKCKEAIEDGYDMYEFEGYILCEDCFDEALDKLKGECLIKY